MQIDFFAVGDFVGPKRYPDPYSGEERRVCATDDLPLHAVWDTWVTTYGALSQVSSASPERVQQLAQWWEPALTELAGTIVSSETRLAGSIVRIPGSNTCIPLFEAPLTQGCGLIPRSLGTDLQRLLPGAARDFASAVSFGHDEVTFNRDAGGARYLLGKAAKAAVAFRPSLSTGLTLSITEPPGLATGHLRARDVVARYFQVAIEQGTAGNGEETAYPNTIRLDGQDGSATECTVAGFTAWAGTAVPLGPDMAIRYLREELARSASCLGVSFADGARTD